MSQRLGELLLREGLIGNDQLGAALRLQARNKQRLGSCLIELGLIDVDTIARALSGQQQLPAVLTKHFENIEPGIIKLFTPGFAAEHQAIPLGFTSATPPRLVVALRDPRTAPLEEIAFMAGTRVDPGIAPEVSIRHGLEKYYGGARAAPKAGAKTDQGYLEVDVGAMYSHSSMPPAADGVTPAAVPTSAARPVTSLTAPPPPATLSAPPPPPALEPARRGEKLTLDEVIAEPVPSSRAVLPPDSGWDLPPPDPDAALELPAVESRMTAPPGMLQRVVDLDQAIAALRAASSRDQVGDVLADYLRSSFGCGLVLIVKSGVALGWKGFAPDAEPEHIQSISIPLGVPSMLTLAHDQRITYRGAPPEEGKALQGRLWKLLRCEPPTQVVVAPVVVSNRVINLLYGHAEGMSELPESAVADLTQLAAVASGEYLRILRSKKS